ncbi:amino acid adenylation protein [Nostoc sp. T09]|nr:amino acid adenylation protein [Nostoc sp. T09]
MKLGFDISDSCAVTSLEWYANKYPEIAERCNNALLELIEKQSAATPAFVGTTYSDNDLDNF